MGSTQRPVADSQKLRALERANSVRIARSRVKAQIASAELTAAEVILSAHWEIERMPLVDVLSSQPQWGRVRCRGFLARLHIAETKTIGSLTKRQRLAAAEALSRNTLSKTPSPNSLNRPRR